VVREILGTLRVGGPIRADAPHVEPQRPGGPQRGVGPARGDLLRPIAPLGRSEKLPGAIDESPDGRRVHPVSIAWRWVARQRTSSHGRYGPRSPQRAGDTRVRWRRQRSFLGRSRGRSAAAIENRMEPSCSAMRRRLPRVSVEPLRDPLVTARPGPSAIEPNHRAARLPGAPRAPRGPSGRRRPPPSRPGDAVGADPRRRSARCSSR
jgi:hypothetical protein